MLWNGCETHQEETGREKSPQCEALSLYAFATTKVVTSCDISSPEAAMDVLDMAMNMENDKLIDFALRHIRAFVLLGHVREDAKCVLTKTYKVRDVFRIAVSGAVRTLNARRRNSRRAHMQMLMVGALGGCTPPFPAMAAYHDERVATREEVAMIRESLQMQRVRLEEAESRADLTEYNRKCISKRWDQYRMQWNMLHFRIEYKHASSEMLYYKVVADRWSE